MSVYGYARVSTSKQNIERQIRNILGAYPDAIIVKEIFTRKSFQGRKEWNKIMKIIKSGDIIVFDSVSRMSGNADEGCDLYEMLFNNGVALVFLKETHINTAVYKEALEKQIQVVVDTGNAATDTLLNTIIEALNKYTMELARNQVRIAFEQSEKEVMDLRQRTREGIETARLNGKQIGLAPGRTIEVKNKESRKEIIRKKSRDFGGSNTDAEVMKDRKSVV